MKGAVLTKEEKRTGNIVAPHDERFFAPFQYEMNKLFEDFRHGFDFWRPRLADTTNQLNVKIDVKDQPKEIVLFAEVPGVDMNDVDVAVTAHYVSISGEKKAEKEEFEKGYHRMERNYGYFRRIIPLPCEIDKENVDAVYKNGVLRIELPKTQAALADEKGHTDQSWLGGGSRPIKVVRSPDPCWTAPSL